MAVIRIQAPTHSNAIDQKGLNCFGEMQSNLSNKGEIKRYDSQIILIYLAPTKLSALKYINHTVEVTTSRKRDLKYKIGLCFGLTKKLKMCFSFQIYSKKVFLLDYLLHFQKRVQKN